MEPLTLELEAGGDADARFAVAEAVRVATLLAVRVRLVVGNVEIEVAPGAHPEAEFDRFRVLEAREHRLHARPPAGAAGH